MLNGYKTRWHANLLYSAKQKSMLKLLEVVEAANNMEVVIHIFERNYLTTIRESYFQIQVRAIILRCLVYKKKKKKQKNPKKQKTKNIKNFCRNWNSTFYFTKKIQMNFKFIILII